MLSFAHRHRFHQADGSDPLATADAAKEGNKKNNVFWAKFILNGVANDILSPDNDEYFEGLIDEAIEECSEQEFENSEDSVVLAMSNQAGPEDGEDFGEEDHEHRQIIKRRCPNSEQLDWL